MPKSRKKKVKHQDFAKVKLKVGKKLPKAANETDASFRSRAIQIKDQFKTGSEGDHSLVINKKKINLKEVFSQCQHYNPGNKHDALKKLHEAVIASPDMIYHNLAVILERCSELFVDKDPGIRSAVCKILRIVFSRTSLNHITPFFPIFSAYLCCAMTHLNEEIQLDSLKVLDIALDHYPELVVTSSSQLLPNLLEQISRQQRASGAGSRKDENARLLAVNPSGLTGSTQWRIDVLQRLRKVLEAVITVKQAGLASDGQSKGDEVKWQSRKSHMVLCQYPSWLTSSYIIQSTGGTSATGVDVLASGQSLKSYLQSLIPLLLQCWVEVGPAQLTSKLRGNTLSQSALVVLSNILAVFDLIMKYTFNFMDDDSFSTDWIKRTYFKDFIHYFMEHFPFAVNDEKQTAGKSKKSSPEQQQVSLLSLNLAVCQVMTYFLDARSMKEQWLENIVVFMTTHLNHCKLSTEELQLSVGVYSQLLQNTPDIKMKTRLLKAALHIYNTRHAKSADLEMMFTFLMNTFFTEQNKQMISLPVFKQWQNSFPKLLIGMSGKSESVVTLILSTLKRCLIHEHMVVGSDILDSCPLLDVDFVSKLSDFQQQLLAEILYSIPTLQQSHFEGLVRLFIRDILCPDVQSYLLRILTQRICLKHTNEKCVGDYLSFLFTLLLRSTEDDRLIGCQQKLDDISPCRFNITCSGEAVDVWLQKHTRIQCVLEELQSLTLPEGIVGQVWVDFVTQALSAVPLLPIIQAVTVLLTTSVLVTSVNLPSEFLLVTSRLLLGCMAQASDSLKSGNVKVDLCDTAVSRDLHVAIPQAGLWCINTVRGLWCCLLDNIKSKMEKGNNIQEVTDTLAILASLCMTDVIKDEIILHKEKLAELMSYLVAKYPQMESTPSYNCIAYCFSLEAK